VDGLGKSGHCRAWGRMVKPRPTGKRDLGHGAFGRPGPAGWRRRGGRRAQARKAGSEPAGLRQFASNFGGELEYDAGHSSHGKRRAYARMARAARRTSIVSSGGSAASACVLFLSTVLVSCVVAETGLILMDSSYIDTSEEGRNMLDTVGAASVSSVSSLSTLISRLSDTPAPGFVIIPEQESFSIDSSLSSGQRSSLATYVSSGGRLVVADIGSGGSRTLLNGVFGWSLMAATCSDTSKVSGSALCDFGHASGLPDINAIYCISIPSLPSSAAVYFASGNAASVVLWQHGSGVVIGLAPDFFQVTTAWGDILKKSTKDFTLACCGQPGKYRSTDSSGTPLPSVRRRSCTTCARAISCHDRKCCSVVL